MSRLTPSQIEEIVTLHNKWLSQRAIARLKWYGRKTIRKYIEQYYQEIVRLSNEINREKFPVKVYSINIFLAWLFLIVVIGLALFGVYTLINF